MDKYDLFFVASFLCGVAAGVVATVIVYSLIKLHMQPTQIPSMPVNVQFNTI